MTTIIQRSLIGHQDFALGQGKVSQDRGPNTVEMQMIELEFIFRTVAEIKALNYALYEHVALYAVGPLIRYYFDSTSMLTADDDLVLLPDTIAVYQPGRYIRVLNRETIICSQSDQVTEFVVDLVNPTNTWRAPFALDLTRGHIRINVNQAPTGAKLIIDIHMNGVTMLSTLISIDIGEKTSVTASVPAVLSVTDVPDDAEFEAFVTQIGSTFAGTGLKVSVTGEPA